MKRYWTVSLIVTESHEKTKYHAALKEIEGDTYLDAGLNAQRKFPGCHTFVLSVVNDSL